MLKKAIKNENLPNWEALVRLPALDWVATLLPLISLFHVYTSNPVVSLTKPLRLVRPIRVRLSSTRLARKGALRICSSTNKKTDAKTSVPIILLPGAIAADMVCVEEGIAFAEFWPAYSHGCTDVLHVADIVLLHVLVSMYDTKSSLHRSKATAFKILTPTFRRLPQQHR